MSDAIRAIVALDDGIDGKLLETALPAGPELQIVSVVEGLDDTRQMLKVGQADLLILACGGYSDKALLFIKDAVTENPERPVVVLCAAAVNGFVSRVFEAGADDIVTLPELPEHVAFALEKAVARRRGAAVASGIAIAPMICVLGPKGGTGKTLVSTNLSVALALAGHRVVLVDLDLQFGDIGLALGLRPDKTIYDLARSGGSLDEDKLDAYLVRHTSGLDVLLAPTRPDQASAVTVDFLRDVFTTLRAMCDFVIVDTPPGFTPEVIAAIDASSDVCVVGMLDSLSLKNTKLGLETLELMGYEPNRISLVLNRADTRVGITHDDVEAIIGRRPEVLIPSDRQIPISVNDGTPIVIQEERSEAARAFQNLADRYRKEEPDKPVTEVPTSERGKRRFAWRS